MLTQSAARIGDYVGMAKAGFQLRGEPSETVRLRARRQMIERMGRLRGLPQKLGQTLGFLLGDPASAQDQARLRERAQPLPLSKVRPILESQWGQPLDQVVYEISPDAHAASLGQVHRATLRDGSEVAIKVQYPGIREGVPFDLKMLGWLSLPVGSLNRGLDITGYRDTIIEDIDRELDYRLEAETQQAFCSWAADDRLLEVPEVIALWSTPTVLVTRWEEGDDWNKVLSDWSQQQKERLAQVLVDFFHVGLFQRGLLHADWHPGNIRFRRSGDQVRLLLYDFGCIHRPSGAQRLALLRLIRATCRQDESPYPLFLKLGFRDEHLRGMATKLPALCRVLLEPYASDQPYHPSRWKLGERVADILGDDRQNFKIAGPPELLFLMRAFYGLNFYLQGLGEPASWNRIVRPLLETFEIPMQSLALPESDLAHIGFQGLARNLRIRVSEHGRTKVQVTHCASAVDRLDSLIDEAVRQRIEQQGIELHQIVSDIRRRGYAPGEVFRLTGQSREILVWLD